MKRIEPEKFGDLGIQISGDEMKNGEKRFRLSSDKSSYIRTEAGDRSVWQNSHYHSTQTEYFLVEKEEVVLATIEKKKVVFRKYSEGDFFAVEPMMPHNLKIGKNGLLHTVKCGGVPDWNECPELDAYLKGEDCNE